MDGLSFWFLDLVKCIRLFFTWSVFSPLCESQVCISLNAVVMVWAVESNVGPNVRMAPSSTYNVIGDSDSFPLARRGLSSGDDSKCVVILCSTSSIIGHVKYVARIGDMHDPCGMPVSIRQSTSLFPSGHKAAWCSFRNEWTHCVMGNGRWSVQRVLIRWEWGIVLKKPVMSKVSMDALHLWFQAVSISCTMQRRASSADLPGILPNCDKGNRLCFDAMYESLCA